MFRGARRTYSGWVTAPLPVPPPEPGPSGRRPAWRLAWLGSWRGPVTAMVVIAGLLWLVELVNLATDGRLDDYGIRPRTLGGLWGVATAPLLHASVPHLVGNTLPLVVLGILGLVGNARRFVLATALVWLVSGVGVWLAGPSDAVTVGASGIIYGWLGYLIVRGWVAHRLRQALLGVAVLVVYGGGALWGLLPLVNGHVSWQGHLFGAVGGVLSAFLLDRRRDREPRSPGPAMPTLPDAPAPTLPGLPDS